MTCQVMPSLGPYVLGAADTEKRQFIEGHIADCLICQDELLRLAPLPGLLSRLPADMVPEGAPADRIVVPPAPRGAQRRPGPRLRARPWRAAAAFAAAAAVGLAGGFALAHRDTGRPPPPPTITFSGVNPASHVQATAALTATSWGTSIELVLRGVPLNVQCRLVAHSRGGGTEVTGMWSAWKEGPFSVPASAAWKPSDITSLQVVSATGSLVTMASAADAAGSRASPHAGQKAQRA